MGSCYYTRSSAGLCGGGPYGPDDAVNSPGTGRVQRDTRGRVPTRFAPFDDPQSADLHECCGLSCRLPTSCGSPVWDSATFNNAANKVVFTDELGGGGSPTCNPTVGDKLGADAVYDIVGGQLQKGAHFKIPRTKTNEENCVAHNGSLIPNTQGRDLMVQSCHQGGISVWDFTDSAKPRAIAWFDRGPISASKLVLAGSWSAYFYSGLIYSSDIQQGFDVLKLNDPAISGSGSDKTATLYPQSQTPDTFGASGRSR